MTPSSTVSRRACADRRATWTTAPLWVTDADLADDRGGVTCLAAGGAVWLLGWRTAAVAFRWPPRMTASTAGGSRRCSHRWSPATSARGGPTVIPSALEIGRAWRHHITRHASAAGFDGALVTSRPCPGSSALLRPWRRRVASGRHRCCCHRMVWVAQGPATPVSVRRAACARTGPHVLH